VAQRLVVAEEERGTVRVGAHQLVAQRVELALQRRQQNSTTCSVQACATLSNSRDAAGRAAH
jgi:hypothetical protein